MLLDAVDKSIEVYLGAAKTTNDCPVTAFYVDHVAAGGTPGASDATTNGVTVFTAVAAPAVATRRQVKMITVYNADTVNTDIYIQLNHGGTTRLLGKFTVLPGETLVYQNEIGFKINPTMSEITIMGDASLANQTLILGNVATVDGIVDTLTTNMALVPKEVTHGLVVADGANSATQFKTDLTEATADHYNDMILVFTSGVDVGGQARRVTDYDGANKIITVAALAATPTVGNAFQIQPNITAAGVVGGDATIANQNLILADVGDASASTLTSVYGILGNPATTITAQITDVHGHAATADSESTAAHVDAGTAATQATNAASDAVLIKADVGDASASTLTSIYGILGNPATTITAQITDVHGHADTAATDTGLLKADLGDASASTLTSIYGILGNPATTITAQLTAIDDYIDTEVASLMADVGDASASTLGSIYAILGNPAATAISTDVAAVHVHAETIETDVAAVHVHVGSIETKVDTLDTNVDTLNTRLNRYQHKDIFWSAPQITVTVDTTHTDAALPSVILPNIAGTIIHVYAGFKFRMISNSNAAANKLSGAQEIQVKENAAGAFTDCINFVDDQFAVALSTREGGDVCMGNIDVVAEVAAFNKTYAFQWDEPLSDQTALIFWDVQTFLIVTWY